MCAKPWQGSVDLWVFQVFNYFISILRDIPTAPLQLVSDAQETDWYVHHEVTMNRFFKTDYVYISIVRSFNIMHVNYVLLAITTSFARRFGAKGGGGGGGGGGRR